MSCSACCSGPTWARAPLASTSAAVTPHIRLSIYSHRLMLSPTRGRIVSPEGQRKHGPGIHVDELECPAFRNDPLAIRRPVQTRRIAIDPVGQDAIAGSIRMDGMQGAVEIEVRDEIARRRPM